MRRSPTGGPGRGHYSPREKRGAPSPLSLVARGSPDDLLGLALELEDVQPRVGAIDDVDEAAVVGRDVVRLDDLPADVGNASQRATPQVGRAGRLGNEGRHLRRVVRIADVDGSHAGVEGR